MTCTPHLRAARPAAVAATIAAAMVATATAVAPTARAQNPTPPPPTPPVVVSALPPTIAAYRAPVLALVQPPPTAVGGVLTVPQDRPVVVFRFAQGEADDPIDAASFRVAVDGRDRTARFQVAAPTAAVTAGAAGEAWGPLGDADTPLAAGAHQVAARVCSSRGACATVDVTLTAVPAASVTAIATTTGGKAGRRALVIGLVLQAAKRLLTP